MLNHELVPSRRGNGRQGTHRAGTVRPGTGGGSREDPQEPSSQPTLTTLLAPGLRARGCGCARGSPPPSGTLHGTRLAPSRAQAPSGTFRHPKSIAGRSRLRVLPYSRTPPSCPSACSPSSVPKASQNSEPLPLV